MGLVEWWLEATTWEPMTGTPGTVEWPYPGGLLEQPARLAEAVMLLRSEWPYVPRPSAPEKR
jgi:hypothetical protein